MDLFDCLGRQVTIDGIQMDPDLPPSTYGVSLTSVTLDDRDEVVIAISAAIATLEQIITDHGPNHPAEIFDLLDQTAEVRSKEPAKGNLLIAIMLGHTSYCQLCAEQCIIRGYCHD